MCDTGLEDRIERNARMQRTNSLRSPSLLPSDASRQIAPTLVGRESDRDVEFARSLIAALPRIVDVPSSPSYPDHHCPARSPVSAALLAMAKAAAAVKVKPLDNAEQGRRRASDRRQACAKKKIADNSVTTIVSPH